MCGICGTVHADAQRPINERALRRMTDIMRHRGPDSDGYYVASGVGLGVRRLAINDLQTGDQPIANEDGSIVVICNGEIYNFVELRQTLQAAGHHFRTGSDVEVIVHLYEDEGPACLARLRGMFAFALWDARRQRLMLARDRFGIKPLHFLVDGEGLRFGSEQKCLLVGGDVDRRLDVGAMRDLFSLGFVTGDRTFFTGIRQVLAGHYLLYQHGQATHHQYWDLRFPEPGDVTPRPAASWAEAVREALSDAVRLHVRSDAPLGAWLSPGIDSSSIVSLMRDYLPSPPPTFTLGFDDPRFDETARYPTLNHYPGYDLTNERATATAADLARLPTALWHHENPFISGNEISGLRLAELTSSRVKVVLTGEGADECFGGYAWFRLDRLLRPLANLPLALRQTVLVGGLAPTRWPRASSLLLAPPAMTMARYQPMVGPFYAPIDHLLAPDLRQRMATATTVDHDLAQPDGFARWHPFNQVRYYEFKLRLVDFINHQLDRTSMAASVEARVPFLDHPLVELCTRVPPDIQMRWRREKHLLRLAMRDRLPAAIVGRKKHGLRPPLATWLRGPVPEQIEDLLTERGLRAAGYFEPAAVADLLARHRAGVANYAHHLLAIMTVQLWDTMLAKGCRPPADDQSLSERERRSGVTPI